MYKEKKLQDKEVEDNVLKISTLLNGREVAEILKISRGNKLVKSSYHRGYCWRTCYTNSRRKTCA